MSLYYKIIFLYFKKGLTMIEISNVLSVELDPIYAASQKEFPDIWFNEYTPINFVQQIIGHEIATHYKLGEFNKFQNVEKYTKRHYVRKYQTNKVL